MRSLVITSEEEAQRLLWTEQPVSHLISIRRSDLQRDDQAHIRGARRVPRYLRLCFDDVSYEHLEKILNVLAPKERHVQAIIDFAATVTDESDVLIHCAAGISRSTAAAFILLCVRFGGGQEERALDEVVRVRPQARPNRLMVEIADRLLNREGRMVIAVAAHVARMRETKA